jgi:hypothetical protein
MTSTPLNTPSLTLGAVNIAATDPARLAEFWAAATGGTITGSHEGSVYVTPASGGVAFFIQPSAISPQRGAIHLDLTAAPGTRASEVQRLIALGATQSWDVLGEVPWVDWTTMADPEGNLFCVAEHNQ